MISVWCKQTFTPVVPDHMYGVVETLRGRGEVLIGEPVGILKLCYLPLELLLEDFFSAFHVKWIGTINCHKKVVEVCKLLFGKCLKCNISIFYSSMFTWGMGDGLDPKVILKHFSLWSDGNSKIYLLAPCG